MLIYAASVSRCLPGDPLFAAQVVQKLHELLESDVPAVATFVAANPEGDTWLTCADQPTVLDFYAAAFLHEMDAGAVAATHVAAVMSLVSPVSDDDYDDDGGEEESAEESE